MKVLILTLLSIFVFYGCNISPIGGSGESALVSVQSSCTSQYLAYKHYLGECDLYDEESFGHTYKECFLYDDIEKYSNEEYDKDGNCGNNTEKLTCEELANVDKLGDIDGCLAFPDKPLKSKKQICSENYFLFCGKQLSRCGEENLDSKCEAAKSMTGGEDSYLSFKMSKMLEYCDSEANKDATVNDLDCILETEAFEFNCTGSFEDYRAGCTRYFE